MRITNTTRGTATEDDEAHDVKTDLDRRPHGVTPRAFILGLVLALSVCAILPYNDYYIDATPLSGNLLPVSSIFGILMIVMGINPALIALGRRDKIFTPAEIITVWTILVVTVGIPSSGLMRYLIPHIVAPYYFANSANNWTSLILSRVPNALLVTDPYAVHTFYTGLKHGASVPWKAWARPLSLWSVFVFMLFALFFSLSSIIRRQWVEIDRLTFPLTRLPLLMSERPDAGHYHNAFLRSRLLWLAVGLDSCIHTVKGLHTIYPSIPDITTKVSLSTFVTSPPWNSIGDTQFAIYPLIIGIAYLLSDEVCFSLWFFFLIYRAQTLLGVIYAWDTSGGDSAAYNASYQEAGGALFLAAWLIWSMRDHLRTVLRKALGGDGEIDDSREALSYRTAVIATIVSSFGMFAWLVFIADVNPLMAAAVLFGAFCIFLLLSWLVAQGGMFFTGASFSPAQITAALGGAQSFNAPTLFMASMTEQVGWFDAREIMMPSILNSYKASSESGLASRSLTKALGTCVVLAVFVSGAASIWLPYTHGGATALPNSWTYVSAPQLPLQFAASHLTGGAKSTSTLLPNAIGGALFVAGLFALRARFVSFNLHPAGFLVAAASPIWVMWFSLFLGSVIKAPIVRYGGIKVYRAALPFFMGLILGDCLNALVWTIVGLVTKIGYNLMPG